MKTKKVNNKSIDSTMAGVSTDSYHKIFKKNRYLTTKIWKTISSPAITTTVQQIQLDGVAGQQLAQTISTSFAGDTLNNFANDIAVIPAATNADYNKLFIENYSSELCFRNGQGHGVTVWIYDVVAKIDYATLRNPVSDWQIGMQSTNYGVSDGNQTLPFTKPSVSPFFQENWKIEKCTRVHLVSGALHRHHQFYKVNKMLDGSKLATRVQIKGFTRRTFAVVLGDPVTDTDASDNFSGESTLLGVGFANTKVYGYYTQRYKARGAVSNPSYHIQTTNMNAALTSQFGFEQSRNNPNTAGDAANLGAD